MSSKLYDLAVKTGEYTDSQGQTKGRYENVGSVMRSDDGGQFIIMKKTFNPAGVVDQRDSVLISCFEPRQPNNQPQYAHQSAQPVPAPPLNQPQGVQQRAPQANNDIDDDPIPF